MYKYSMARPKKSEDDKTKTLIRRAGNKNNLLKIWYTDRKGKDSVRLTEPYEIRGGDLFAYCKNKDNIRRFKISNIKKATISKKTFENRWPLKLASIMR